jgi:hypothetical protein
MSKPTTSSIYFDSTIPDGIKIPFPPKTSVYDLLSRTKLPDGTNKRIPNAFIIYRKTLHHELVSKGYKFSLSQLSIMASSAWKNESEEVKQAYIDLVNNAKNIMSSLQDKNDGVIKNANYEGANLRNNITAENRLFSQLGNSLFLNDFNDSSYSSFNDLVTTGNVGIDDTFIVPESSLNERIRVLEERQKLMAERLGIRF